MPTPRLLETHPDVSTTAFLTSTSPSKDREPEIIDMLRRASDAIDHISREHAAAPSYRLAEARSYLDRATMLARHRGALVPQGDHGVVDVAKLLCGLYPLLRMMCPSGHRLTMTTSPVLPVVSCSPIALEAVVQSLILHACRETPGGGDVVMNAIETTGFDGRSQLQFIVRSSAIDVALPATTGEGRRAVRDRIGLSLAIRFTQLRNGELHVDRPENGQVAITLRLPALRARRSPAR